METPDGCVATPVDGAGAVAGAPLTEADVRTAVAEIARAINAHLRDMAASDREAAA